jgi:multiple sugar transport system ATP-binding protein
MATVALEQVTKVKSVDLSIDDGEFVVLVGPSGCGKTTVLRMVAGLEDVTSGTIRLNGERANDLSPGQRDVAMVFQNYALYPHLNVHHNIGFSLAVRKVPKAVRDEKIRDAAELLGLVEVLDAKPRQLSGGQRQRVAMGRALVREPAIFLMDEPLSNLDASLRVQMRTEVMHIQRRLGAATMYVTHDQTEAMTMGDRVAVMRQGVLQQFAPPQELYDRPANVFVASFIGSPAMNILRGTLQQDGAPLVRIGSSRWPLPQRLYAAATAMNAGPEVAYGIRHRDLAISRSEMPESVHGIVYAVEPTGDITFVHVRVGSDQIVASVEPDVMFAPDEDVWLIPDLNRLHFFDGATGLAIRDAITSPGQMARANFASEAMAIEDTPIDMEIPSVTGSA